MFLFFFLQADRFHDSNCYYLSSDFWEGAQTTEFRKQGASTVVCHTCQEDLSVSRSLCLPLIITELAARRTLRKCYFFLWMMAKMYCQGHKYSLCQNSLSQNFISHFNLWALIISVFKIKSCCHGNPLLWPTSTK